jgi:DNA-binding MarR family transcriptional regulator
MAIPTETDRDLVILEHIEQNPDSTQASLAAQLDVAVGTINWHLKRLIEKGYVKVRHAERRKLRYIITPEGVALRAHLTIDYIQNQFRLYRLVRERAVMALETARTAGFNRIYLVGNGEVAEVCRLTCLERGMSVSNDSSIPVIEVRGLKFFVMLNGKELM